MSFIINTCKTENKTSFYVTTLQFVLVVFVFSKLNYFCEVVDWQCHSVDPKHKKMSALTLVLSNKAWLSKSMWRSARANLLRSLSNCCRKGEEQAFKLDIGQRIRKNATQKWTFHSTNLYYPQYLHFRHAA